MTFFRSAKRQGLLWALFLLLAACSDSGDSEEPASAETESGTSLLGSRFGVPETRNQRIAAAAEIEQRVAVCMRERGFDYVPFVTAPGAETTRIGGEIPGSVEFIERYGFGQSTLLIPQSEAPPGVIGFDGTWETRETPNPNIQAQIDDPAFGKALHGGFDAGPSLPEDGELPCMTVGQRQANAFVLASLEEAVRIEEILVAYEEETLDLVFASQEWRDEVAEVSLCLKADGYDRESDALLAVSGFDVFTALEDSIATVTDDIFFGDATIGPVDLVDLQTRELDVAKRALECGYNSLRDRSREIGRLFEPEVSEDMELELLWIAEFYSS